MAVQEQVFYEVGLARHPQRTGLLAKPNLRHPPGRAFGAAAGEPQFLTEVPPRQVIEAPRSGIEGNRAKCALDLRPADNIRRTPTHADRLASLIEQIRNDCPIPLVGFPFPVLPASSCLADAQMFHQVSEAGEIRGWPSRGMTEQASQVGQLVRCLPCGSAEVRRRAGITETFWCHVSGVDFDLRW